MRTFFWLINYNVEILPQMKLLSVHLVSQRLKSASPLPAAVLVSQQVSVVTQIFELFFTRLLC